MNFMKTYDIRVLHGCLILFVTQNEVKRVTSSCRSCLFLKPQFLHSQGTLIKALSPFQRINVDFKGPLPASKSGYLFTLMNIHGFPLLIHVET